DLRVGSRTTSFALARLVRRLRALRPDVLFAHLNGPSRIAVVARRLAGVPTAVVVVEHTHYDTFYRTHRWARDRLTALLYPRADCVAGVAPHGVQDHVSIAGYQPDALPYIAHADVFALASTTEGMSMVLVEAMALGVPVVTTDCPGGVSFVVDGGRCGLLVPVGNSQAMASALVALLRKSPMRDELVAAGRARAPEFSPR